MTHQKLGWILALLASLAVAGTREAIAQTADPAHCYYVPEAGDVANPTVGANATQQFHMCPNNDGNTSLPNSVRIKVFINDASGNPAFTTKDMICMLLNGGTAAQSFTGPGADSIIANSTWNQSPQCPNLTCIQADADPVGGIAYITFAGGDPLNPGHALRDPCRKWGHYDSQIPVRVNGVSIAGRLLAGSPTPTYSLRIKNLDWTGGLLAIVNQGEIVSTADFNGIQTGLGINNTISYWKDFNSSGCVDFVDFNMISLHVNHDCDSPNNDSGGCP